MICHTIKEILNHAAEAYGGEDAVRYKAGKHEIASKSYAQLLEDSERISGVLKELGPQGMHVALTGMTSYLWIASYFGIVGSGDVAVPLDVSLPAAELCELIDRSDAEVFLYDELRRDAAELAREKCPKLRYILPMQPGAGSLPEAMESARRYSVQADPDALCTIMFTSGTTGKSKGVMLTQRNLAENATCLDMKLPSRAVTLSVLPIHHAYCLGMDILKALSLGTVICINAGGQEYQAVPTGYDADGADDDRDDGQEAERRGESARRSGAQRSVRGKSAYNLQRRRILKSRMD